MIKNGSEDAYAQAIERVMTRAAVSMDDVAIVFGVSRNSAFKAAMAGQIPTVLVGKLRRAPTAPLREVLGLKAPASTDKVAA